MYRRDEDNGGLLEAGMLPNHSRKLEAVHVRHADVGEHDRNIILEQYFEGFSSGARLEQIFPQFGKHDLVSH